VSGSAVRPPHSQREIRRCVTWQTTIRTVMNGTFDLDADLANQYLETKNGSSKL
jgi:hypothetical protein